MSVIDLREAWARRLAKAAGFEAGQQVLFVAPHTHVEVPATITAVTLDEKQTTIYYLRTKNGFAKARADSLRPMPEESLTPVTAIGYHRPMTKTAWIVEGGYDQRLPENFPSITKPTEVYRGVSLAIEGALLKKYVSLMTKGDTSGAARMMVGLAQENHRGGWYDHAHHGPQESTGLGVWWSTDRVTALRYSKIWTRDRQGDVHDGEVGFMLTTVAHPEHVETAAEVARLGYSDEAPVIFKPGAPLTVTAVDLWWTPRWRSNDTDAWAAMASVHVPVSIGATA